MSRLHKPAPCSVYGAYSHPKRLRVGQDVEVKSMKSFLACVPLVVTVFRIFVKRYNGDVCANWVQTKDGGVRCKREQ